MPYEKLLHEAHLHNIDIYEEPMKPSVKGLYADNVIWINKNIDTTIEKACVLAEEIGHYYTSHGDIIDQSKISNSKQERLARKWATEKLIPLENFIAAFNAGCKSCYEVAENLDVTEEFLQESLKFYKEKYGREVRINENHYLLFDPLAIYKTF